MWKKEGMYGMLKGNGVNVVRIAPFSAFEFFFYDLYKNFFFGGVDASIPAKLACGGLTGMTASFLTYPLDLIRTMLSVQVDDVNSKKPTILGTGKQIFQRDGVRGLYRGLPATLYVRLKKFNLSILGYHTVCRFQNGFVRYS
jgi:solute carrier family 25 phosphate transporter 23/24/25/41